VACGTQPFLAGACRVIVYLVTADHAYTLNRYLQDWAPSLVDKVQPVFYEENPWQWLELEATYIFSDIERLTPAEMKKATAYAEYLASKGFRVLNDPRSAPTRLALQSLLNSAGINPFRMLPVNAANALVFPVFLRLANSHQGSVGDLIHSQIELEQRLATLDSRTAMAEDLVVVEYCDTRNADGRYVKYSAMRVGKGVLPRHAMTSAHWMIKTPDIVDTAALKTEHDFLHGFSQRQAIENIFLLGKLDFGRIDFGLQEGEIRVWEINTNPTFMPAKKGLHPDRQEMIHQTNLWLIDALQAIDSPTQEPEAWRKVAKRHTRKRKLWWLQRKLFRRKRA